MGNNIGLTQQDALQLGNMYGCEDQVKNFKLCTPDPNKCTKEACGCHQDATESGELIKTEDAQGCKRCLRRCPDYNRGTAGVCGCPNGMTKGGWESGGKKFSYCKASPAPPKAPPPSPPASPRPAPAPVAPQPAPAAPAGHCGDKEWWCTKWSSFDIGKHCSPSMTINGLPVLEACKARCGICSGNPPCVDMYSTTCERNKRYCTESVGSVKIGGTVFPDACKKTCGKC